MTRLQTLKPYVENDKYKCVVMVFTALRGCERGLIELKHYDDELEQVELRIHRALVQAVCEHWRIDINSVNNLHDNRIDSSALGPKPLPPRMLSSPIQPRRSATDTLFRSKK